ncbi:hypothetical protein QR680_004648 [Steinernema hermaphroditum]|uniref:Uncharacterized protein n=1 Tax=Steinernema hermaphroditum TaxID=289476 RepID=A0AA39LTI9_9BILA|nr:hypothetical protein QR680_004648 [Steinernema hermaphroditum]
MQLAKIKWMFRMHHICSVALYMIFLLCIFLNLYVLLSRDDTIYYLRIYHLIVGFLMISCGIVMIEFLFRTRTLPKLDIPHEMPRPALIGAVALTIGIVIGYIYFIVFNYAFQNCDKLVDALYGSEFWLEVVYSVIMVLFCALSLVYILQRCYYGAINTNLDKVCRLWINVTFCVVWVKIVVYKGYLSHQELCQRKELEGYWCPVMKRHYECSPADDLNGTQKIWYYLNKGLLNSAIISCASEFFPVLLIAHWLACGGAEEKADDLLRKRQMRQGVRGLLREFMKDISRVYTANPNLKNPPLRVQTYTKICVNGITYIATALMIVRWFIFFYYSIDFDTLALKHWNVNDYMQIVANSFQLLMFLMIWRWTWCLNGDRLDAHHKAQARGDIIILFGCALLLLIKFCLQAAEIECQRADGFIRTHEAILRTISLAMVQATLWIQYLCVRKLLALNDKDIRATRHFLPSIALCGVLLAWIHFGSTFLDTSVIKYQLTDDKFDFSQSTLVIMIFTQTIFPADYLYAFTVSGCWLEVVLRYLETGWFQLGVPRLVHGEAHHGDDEEGGVSFLHAALRFAHRKRFGSESTISESSEEDPPITISNVGTDAIEVERNGVIYKIDIPKYGIGNGATKLSNRKLFPIPSDSLATISNERIRSSSLHPNQRLRSLTSKSAATMASIEDDKKPKVLGTMNLKTALGELTKTAISSTSPSAVASKLPKGARIIRLSSVAKKPDSLGTIIGSGGQKAPQLSPQASRPSTSAAPLTYNDRVEWSTTEDGSEVAIFHSTRYPNHTFKFFVSTRANGDKYAYCMQCLDVNQRRTELQQSVLSQPTIQIINKRWMEHPDFPKENHICMGAAADKGTNKKTLPDTSNLKVIRFKSAVTGAPKPQLEQAGPYRTLVAGRTIGSGLNRGRIIINNYKLKFSVDSMKILRDTPGGPYIIEEMIAANGDASKVQNRVRLSLVRIMTEYLMQNCMRPGFPTTNERITYTQMFLAQLPVTFDVLPFSRPKGYIDKRIKRLRHSLSTRKRINGNVPMPLVMAARSSSLSSSERTARNRSTKSSSRSEDDDYDDESESAEDVDDNDEESQIDGDEADDSQLNDDLGDEDDEMDVEGSTNNLLLNVIEDQIMSEQARRKQSPVPEKVTISVKVKGDNDVDDGEKAKDLDTVKPSTSSAHSHHMSTITTPSGKKRRIIVIKSNQNGDATPPKIAHINTSLTPAQNRDLNARRSYLEQLKQSNPEKYVSRYMERYPRIFQSNKSIHEEFLNICPQVKSAQPGNFSPSWKAFWTKRIVRYVKNLNIDEVFDLGEDADDDTVSRHAFDQLLFVFMTKQREYFRDHLWKIVLKCTSIDDLNKLMDDSTPVEHPIIVQLTRGVVSQYFVVCDKEIIPVEGKFTEALQLLVELYHIFGMDYPWEYVRWFQFFEYVYGIRAPGTLENRKLFDALKAVSLKT